MGVNYIISLLSSITQLFSGFLGARLLTFFSPCGLYDDVRKAADAEATVRNATTTLLSSEIETLRAKRLAVRISCSLLILSLEELI